MIDDTPTDRFQAHYAGCRDAVLKASDRWQKNQAPAGRIGPAAAMTAQLAVVAQRIREDDHTSREAALGLFRAMLFRDDRQMRRQVQVLLDAALCATPQTKPCAG